MSVVETVSVKGSVLKVQKKERALPINWLSILLIGLIVIVLGFQVFITVKTEVLRQEAQILLDENTILKNKNIELTAELSTKFNPQVIEKYARERLGMEFAIIAPQTNVVFLNEKDVQSLAEAVISANNGATAP